MLTMTNYLKKMASWVSWRWLATGLALAVYVVVVVGLLGSVIAGFLLLVSLLRDPRAVHLDTWWRYLVACLGLAAIPAKAMLRLSVTGGVGFVLPTVVAWVLWLVARREGEKPLHGAARFAKHEEIRAAKLLGSENKSILLGKYGKQYLSFPGTEFVLLSAPTRGGKGVGAVIPNCLNYSDSLVVLDIKGENYALTSGFRKDCGQDVYLFQPYFSDEDSEGKVRPRSHRWNMLTYVSRKPELRSGDILDIAHILFPDQGDQNDFFRAGARKMFLAYALYLLDTPDSLVSVGEIFRLSRGRGSGKPAKEYMKELIAEGKARKVPLSEECINALADCLGNPDNTFGSIMSEFQTKMEPWLNPIVDAATSGDDFLLTDVRKKRMTVYVVVEPRKLSVAAPLFNIFFSQLIGQNTSELPEHNPTVLKYQCLMLMDEFTSIGKVGIIAKSVSYIAGYNMRLFLIIQAHSQLKSVYGEDDAKTMIANHAVKLVFPPREQEDAEMCSKELGTYTRTVLTSGVSKPKMIFAKPGSTNESENKSEQARALFLPQEIRELGRADPPVEFVFYEKIPPILTEKIRYYLDPTFKARLRPAVAAPVLRLGGASAGMGTVGPVEVPGGGMVDLNQPLMVDGVTVEKFEDVMRRFPNASAELIASIGYESLFDAGIFVRKPGESNTRALASTREKENPPVSENDAWKGFDQDDLTDVTATANQIVPTGQIPSNSPPNTVETVNDSEVNFICGDPADSEFGLDFEEQDFEA